MNPAVLTPAVAFAVSFATPELGVRLAQHPLLRSAPTHDFERARLSWPGRVVTANATRPAPPSRRRALAARVAVWLPAIALAAAWLAVVLWRGSA